MRPKTSIIFLISLVLICFFAWTAWETMRFRFSKGDLHPKYSSLRADPFGTKALFKVYQEFPDREILRNMRPIREIGAPKDSTLILSGAGIRELNAAGRLDSELYGFAISGGRLLIFLDPSYDGRLSYRSGKGTKKEEAAGKRCPCPSESDGMRKIPGIEIKKGRRDASSGTEICPPISEAIASSRFKSIKPAATSYIDIDEGFKSEWNVLMERDGKAHLVEGKIGKGVIAICTDSYPISNERLLLNADPAFLSWVAGNTSRIVFDEHRKGMTEEKNILWLAKKSKLGFFCAGLFVLAILLIWRNFLTVSNYRPPRAAQEDANLISSSFGNSKGLENMLRLSIGKDSGLAQCGAEFKRSFRYRGIPDSTAAEISGMLEKGKSEPIATYNNLAKLLKERKLGKRK